MKQLFFISILTFLFTNNLTAQSSNGCITCALEEYVGIYLTGGTSGGSGSYTKPGSGRKLGGSSGWTSTSRSIYNGQLTDDKAKSDFYKKYGKETEKLIRQAHEAGLKTNSYPQLIYSKTGEPIFVYKDKITFN